MNNTDFYITLPSDSSKTIFPTNRPSEYTVKLPHRIELNGEWEVGLHSISYTKWGTVQLKGVIQYTVNGEKKRGLKLRNHYETVEQYVEDINNSFEDDKIQFSIESGRVTITLENGYVVNLRKEQAIALGFLKFNTESILKEITSTETGTYRGNLYRETNLYIYCNVIKPQIIGDKSVPLLDIVPSEEGEKGEVTRSNQNVRYVPVQTKSFEEIEVLLRSSTKEPISFQRGRASITLHFKRKRYF